mmetsp:Transcript_2082/g.5063  ORF Transcript_2082/g.5063 Transcript_2082/m.5063 type:complete len:205 (-) Transcript_2082:989-1603(-)
MCESAVDPAAVHTTSATVHALAKAIPRPDNPSNPSLRATRRRITVPVRAHPLPRRGVVSAILARRDDGKASRGCAANLLRACLPSLHDKSRHRAGNDAAVRAVAPQSSISRSCAEPERARRAGRSYPRPSVPRRCEHFFVFIDDDDVVVIFVVAVNGDVHNALRTYHHIHASYIPPSHHLAHPQPGHELPGKPAHNAHTRIHRS